MQTNTKKISIIALVIMGFIGAFVGGIFFGTKFAYKLYKPVFAKEVYARVLSSQFALEQIDKNEVVKGHNLIMSSLGGDIVALDSLIEDEEDKAMKNKMENLLHRIAAHRDKFPQYYTAKENEIPEVKKANTIVNETLRKYKNGS